MLKICLTCVCLCSFFAELNKLAGSSAIDELNVKCGVCKGIKVIAGDRTVSGKVQHFLKSRFSKKKTLQIQRQSTHRHVTRNNVKTL